MGVSHKTTRLLPLKQLVNRWNSLTHRSHSSSSSSSNKQHTPSSGSMPVYVGLERRRFLIPTRFLNFPVFLTLLNKAREEYGYHSSGGIVLPCDVVLFEAVLDLLKRDEKRFWHMEFEEFVGLFSDPGYLFESCKDSLDDGFGAPLLHKMIRV